MEGCIQKVANNVLGVSKGMGTRPQYTWWWNEEVQKVIKAKREWFKRFPTALDSEAYEEYKRAKKEAKKAVSEAHGRALEGLYQQLGTKEGEIGIYKLAKLREKKSRDLNQVKCIKDEAQQVLTKDKEIKGRWKGYFEQLFNSEHEHNFQDLSATDRNLCWSRRIRHSEVKEALKHMKIGKACGPDGIPIEVWKCLGEEGVVWLTKLFNAILKGHKMPNV